MKHFSKLTSVIVASIVLGLGFAGCAGESSEGIDELTSTTEATLNESMVSTTTVSPETSIVTTETTTYPDTSESEATLYIEPTFEHIYGSYNYKGIEFTGYRLKNNNTGEIDDTFQVDLYSPTDGSAEQAVLDFTRDAAMAFIALDYDKLLSYFNEDDAKRQKEYMEAWATDKLDYLVDLIYQSAGFYSDSNDEEIYCSVHYSAAFDYDHSGDQYKYGFIFVSMTIYLNDDGEWRLQSIDYTG